MRPKTVGIVRAVIDSPVALGSWLATVHDATPATLPADDGDRLIDYAESLRTDNWSLRSALVRYAQVEPAGASAILELVRRTDTALHPTRRHGERSTVPRVPGVITPLPFDPAGAATESVGADARAAELARAAHAHPDTVDAILAGYCAVTDLDDDEVATIALYGVALHLDSLADVLVHWAIDPARPRPDDIIDEMGRVAFALLASLGVPRETRPPRTPASRRAD